MAPETVYDYLCRVALTTGCRMGELLALRWSDVSLLEREVRIQRGYVAGIGEQRAPRAARSGRST